MNTRPPKPPVRRCIVSVNGARCPEPPRYPGRDESSFCVTHDDPANAETKAWQAGPARRYGNDHAWLSGRLLNDPEALRRLDRLARHEPRLTPGDHAEHFDAACEECAYLARPTRETLAARAVPDLRLDVEALLVAFYGAVGGDPDDGKLRRCIGCGGTSRIVALDAMLDEAPVQHEPDCVVFDVLELVSEARS